MGMGGEAQRKYCYFYLVSFVFLRGFEEALILLPILKIQTLYYTVEVYCQGHWRFGYTCRSLGRLFCVKNILTSIGTDLLASAIYSEAVALGLHFPECYSLMHDTPPFSSNRIISYPKVFCGYQYRSHGGLHI